MGPKTAAAQDSGSDFLPNGLPRAAATGEPAVVNFDRPFDLSDPLEARYTKIKATNNLAGEKTYVPMFSRAYICPEGGPSHPMFGHCGLWTWQLQKATTERFEDAREDSQVQRGLYTGVILDPYTFKPAEELENPYTGEVLTVEDSVFATNWLLHPIGARRARENPEFSNPDVWPDTLTCFPFSGPEKGGLSPARFVARNLNAAWVDGDRLGCVQAAPPAILPRAQRGVQC